MKQFFAYCLLCIGLFGCANEVVEDDPVLANVHGKTLRLSDADAYLTPGTPVEDSLNQLRTFVNKWVRETLLLHEAELHFPDDINIGDLVRDYRASLIVSNYEKNLVESMLDTVISKEELEEYYEKNKEQYQLERPIIRCHFVKIHRPFDESRDFRKWWDSERPEDFDKLMEFSRQNAEVYMLEDSTWWKVEEIAALMPPGMLSSQNMRSNRSLRFSDDEYEYYLRIAESVLSTEIAPLSYIREQAARYIMHKRKLDLLEQIKADLYDQGVQGEQVKIYIQ